jgi:uncharacterized protein YciI
MYFLITCKDRAGALDQRTARRPDHLGYWQGLGDALKLAGPRLAGDNPCGSFFIVDAPDIAAAQAMIDGDPFASDGIFETVEISPVRLTLGGWKPGE